MMEPGVPVYAPGNGMVINGQPAWLAVLSRVWPPAANSDPVAKCALQA
jgi:hypothetical protein